MLSWYPCLILCCICPQRRVPSRSGVPGSHAFSLPGIPPPALLSPRHFPSARKLAVLHTHTHKIIYKRLSFALCPLLPTPATTRMSLLPFIALPVLPLFPSFTELPTTHSFLTSSWGTSLELSGLYRAVWNHSSSLTLHGWGNWGWGRV